jgi:hypothetical protein
LESEKERDHKEDLKIDGRLMLEKYDEMVWNRFIWLRYGTVADSCRASNKI